MSTDTLTRSRAGFSLEPLAGFESAREEWRELAAASGNVFLTPEWLGAWWETFGEGNALVLRLVRRDDGSAAAILPLYRDPRPPSALRMVGHTQSDLLGPVCAPGDRELATLALREVILAEPADLFVGNSLPRSEAWGETLEAAEISSISSPTLVYAGRDWDGVLADRSNHFRKRVRQVQRRLEREFEVGWELAGAATVAADLEDFIALHDRRWEGESGAFSGKWGELHQRFAPLAIERGWLRLHKLELDGVLAGGLYNLRFEGIDWNYQSARDTGFEKFELGLAMNSRAIEESIDVGMREYRFLRGAEPYKARLADHDDPVETLALPLRLRARPLPALLRMAPKLPNALRRRLLRVVTAMTPASVGVSEFATEGAGAYALVLI